MKVFVSIFLLISIAHLSFGQTYPSFYQNLLNCGAAPFGNYTKNIKTQVNIPASSTDTKFFATPPFEISLDSITFNNVLNLPSNSSTQTINIYLRLLVNDRDTIFKGEILAIKNNNDTASNFVTLYGSSFIPDSFYSVMSWNLLWFGDAGNCNCNVTTQYNNVENFLTVMQPDVVAFQEVVDVPSIASLATAMGNKFESTVGEFGSFADDAQDIDYTDCQKLAFIYNSNIFSKKGAFPFSKNANQALTNTSYYYSSGRYPYMLQLHEQPSNHPLDIMNIHAKAGTTQSDFTRRSLGAIAIRDSVFGIYNKNPLILLGDFNDKLEGSISTNSYSPYYYLFNGAMTGISLPSKYPNKTTYVWNNSIIDNVCINNVGADIYAGTFSVLDEVSKVYNNYGNTTSDHYPVIAYFKRNFETPLDISDNPTPQFEYELTSEYFKLINNNQEIKKVVISNLTGQIMHLLNKPNPNTIIQRPRDGSQIYLIQIIGKNYSKTLKW